MGVSRHPEVGVNHPDQSLIDVDEIRIKTVFLMLIPGRSWLMGWLMKAGPPGGHFSQADVNIGTARMYVLKVIWTWGV